MARTLSRRRQTGRQPCSLLVLGALLLAPGAVALAAAAEAPPAAEIAAGVDPKAKPESRWFARVGVVGALYHSSATITTGGHPIPGASAHVVDDVTLMFDVGYDVTEDVSVMVMSGIPPRTTVEGRGTVASLGTLGAVRYGPVFVTAVYRFAAWNGFRPYAGAGVGHAFVFRNFDGAVSQLDVHGNTGPALQAGVEYRLSKRWDAFVDYKRLWLYLNVDGSLASAPIKARVTLDPDLVSVGLKYHF
jgi:outer membrane protein